MHSQQQTSPLRHSLPVISNVGAIGCAHLAQNGARMLHDLWYPEPIANLDQLAARDYHLIPGRQLMQREIDGCGIVVDHDRGGAQQGFEESSRVDVALAASTRRQVVLEI